MKRTDEVSLACTCIDVSPTVENPWIGSQPSLGPWLGILVLAVSQSGKADRPLNPNSVERAVATLISNIHRQAETIGTVIADIN